MCFAAAIPIIAAVISAGAQMYSADRQRSSANEARDAAATGPGSQQVKTPDVSPAANGTADNAASGSAANTLLTGVGGIDPNNLSLGRNTLGGTAPSALGTNSLLGM